MDINRFQEARRRAAGFTLIELLITMVMLAILAAIAIPSYQGYVRRGQLSDAFRVLSDMQVKMEQWYQDNKFYGTTVATATCATLPGYTAFPVTSGNFRVDCAAGAAPSQTFTLTAVGIGGLTSGFDYTLNQQGTKGTANFHGAASTAPCWLTKPGSCDN
jgi:type IV pilus assembly protein PilE